MYCIIAFTDSCELVILERQNIEYCTSVALDLYCKSKLSFRIVSEESNETVVSFIR